MWGGKRAGVGGEAGVDNECNRVDVALFGVGGRCVLARMKAGNEAGRGEG